MVIAFSLLTTLRNLINLESSESAIPERAIAGITLIPTVTHKHSPKKEVIVKQNNNYGSGHYASVCFVLKHLFRKRAKAHF